MKGIVLIQEGQTHLDIPLYRHGYDHIAVFISVSKA